MSEEELEQERINKEERLENLEKCIERIKETLRARPTTMEDLLDMLSEIQWEISCLD